VKEGYIINGIFILTYIVLPVFTLPLLGICFFGKKKIVGKTVLCILLLIVFVLLFMFLSGFGNYEMLSIYENDQIDHHYTQIEEFNYPKRLMFVATNDETNEIVYLSFYDDDLDYIVSLGDFLIDDCGWKHIR
jgi:hypothetical protein